MSKANPEGMRLVQSLPETHAQVQRRAWGEVG